jgi:2-polyprenyl-3-methyl-5-hydroxy-6-metoxy-1,4-benzoquinol methylase
MENRPRLKIDRADVQRATELSGYKFIAHQQRKAKIIAMVMQHHRNGNSVLDVGCGNGDIAVELAQHGLVIHGIDLEPDRLERARKLAEKYGKEVTFKCTRIEHADTMPQFDIIVMGEVLEHFEDPVGILVKMKRQLKPDGFIVITTPNMPSLRNRLQFGLLGIFPDNNPEHKFYFDRRRFMHVVGSAGFRPCFFETCFTNLVMQGRLLTRLENLLLFWFPKVFRNSGDTLCAVIQAEQSPYQRHG